MGKLIQPKKLASIKILIVDDEPENLKLLRAELEHRFEIMTAEDGIEAQLMLECNNDFDLIIADQSMPIMSGMALFKWVRIEHPHTPKILLAEMCELTEEIRSITDDHAFFCLNKSIKPQKLIEAIDLAVIGVKPALNAAMQMVDDIQEIQAQFNGCKMAVLDADTKNWPTYDKLTKESGLINEVIYYRNPLLLLERLKKDSGVGVVCIDFATKDPEVNEVIERISRLKHHANVILMCGFEQAAAAVDYQFKGIIYQRFINPGPLPKLLIEIESAAVQFLSNNAQVQAPVVESLDTGKAHNLINQTTSQHTEVLH